MSCRVASPYHDLSLEDNELVNERTTEDNLTKNTPIEKSDTNHWFVFDEVQG